MNFMDLIPVDFLPAVAKWVGVSIFGADPSLMCISNLYPTTDINATVRGMSTLWFFALICVSNSIKVTRH